MRFLEPISAPTERKQGKYSFLAGNKTAATQPSAQPKHVLSFCIVLFFFAFSPLERTTMVTDRTRASSNNGGSE